MGRVREEKRSRKKIKEERVRRKKDQVRMRDEKLQAVVTRSTCGTQNV